jgi:hypothetical protein
MDSQGGSEIFSFCAVLSSRTNPGRDCFSAGEAGLLRT